MTKESPFLKDVTQGLSQNPKTLPSQYFYNETGDRLFQEIMEMPEYYLTKCEAEIFQNQNSEIIASFGIPKDQSFELIELGAGDGTKTLFLLQELLHQQYDFTYLPVDISQNALHILEQKISKVLPELKMEPRQGDYFQVLDQLSDSAVPKVILFIGSNLGNMEDDISRKFLKDVSSECRTGDKVLLGVDLIKKSSIVLPAYHDAAGITRNFNLNLLSRMNEELGANFNLQDFEHAPEYTEDEGIAKSYLKSLKKQTVHFQFSDVSYYFEEGEKMLTEISRKYNDEVLNSILEGSDLEIKSRFLDSKGYFADYILEKN